MWCYAGSADKGNQEIRKLINQTKEPLFEHIGEMPYPTLQGMFDPLYPKGLNWYWKGNYIKKFDEDGMNMVEKFGRTIPTTLSTMHLYPIDGAVHEVGENETAFNYRDVTWSQVIVGVDHDPQNNDLITQWARDFWQGSYPYSVGAGYSNFMMKEEDNKVKATFGENYERLTEIKAKYDPDNLFQHNQNIKPKK